MKKKLSRICFFILFLVFVPNLSVGALTYSAPFSFLDRTLSFFVKVVVENKKDWKNFHKIFPFEIACAAGDTERAKYLLFNKKPDINNSKFMGHTPLQLASFFGNLETVKFLIANGADASIKNFEGKTALDLARSQYFSTIENYLAPLTYKEEDLNKTEGAYRKVINFFIRQTFSFGIEVQHTLFRLCNTNIYFLEHQVQKKFYARKGEELEEINDAFAKIQQFKESQIFEDKMIGAGGFGVVYTIKFMDDFWLQNIPLASKRGKVSVIKQIKNPEEQKRKLDDLTFKMKLEAGLLDRFFNKNIVTLFGVSFDELNIPILILKYYRGGDLSHYLFKRGKIIPKQRKIMFAIQLAQALKYLSDLDVIHRDLKSGNVLIDDEGNLVLKITDFGLAKKKPKKLYKFDQSFDDWCTGKSGTLGYKAPEIILNKSKYSTAADVFSFGIILFNIAEQKAPYTKQQNALRRKIKEEYKQRYKDKEVDFENPRIKEQLKRKFKYKFEQMILKGLRPQISPKNIFGPIISDCMLADPSKRPTFNEILQELQKL